MTNPYDLIAEARAKFGELTAAEEKMLRCAASGDVAYCGPSEKDDDPANDPANAAQWGKDRNIRAKLIRWLCVDHEARKHVDPLGIQVQGATIGDASDEKHLNLSGAILPFGLTFIFSNFNVPFRLTDARAMGFNLAHSRIPELDLRRASIGPIGDDEQSWARKGNLLLDGFIYERIGEGPIDADKRLEWLARQPDGFFPQPFQQLAKVLREHGDDAGARKVLIAMEDARLEHGGLGWTQRIVSRILRATVGYGYTPLRVLRFIVAFVLLGTALFWWGHTAKVITPIGGKDFPQQIVPFNPFIYSLENFVPLVDLHMARNWMPDPNAKPIQLVGPFSDTPMEAPAGLGRFLRCYLWVHILLGWFFSLMFVAGVTGLVRRE